MEELRVSIGQIKRDISDLVNRVAYRGERIVLTSRGKPKAALVSMEDYERLCEQHASEGLEGWRAWRRASEALSAEILARRHGAPIDVEAIWQAVKAEEEERDAKIVGC